MKPSVLIVDDEAGAREALSRVLASHGYAVRTVADSQEAMREMEADPADVVLLDLALPHMPGDSLAAFLRIRHPKTRIMFMSGQYDMVNPERFGEGTVYFRKPLNLDSLIEALEAEKGAEDVSTRV